MDPRQLKEIIAQAMDDHALNPKKIAEVTGIPERYVRLFLDGELRKLPPAPYVRGYLNKIAPVLELDRDILYQTYRNETSAISSGALDLLPKNRFAIQSRARTLLLTGVIIAIIIGYAAWNSSKLIGAPQLELLSPAAEITNTTSPIITIEGNANYNDKVTVNSEQIYLGTDGHFKKEYTLQNGLNTFEIVAKKFLGQEKKITRKVILQETPAVVSTPPTSSTTPIEKQLPKADTQ